MCGRGCLGYGCMYSCMCMHVLSKDLWVSFLRLHKLFLFYFLETMSLSSMVPVGEANRAESSSAGSGISHHVCHFYFLEFED